jgi:hypothetical protein
MRAAHREREVPQVKTGKEKGKRKLAPPVRRSEEIISEVCDRLGKGETLASICRDSRMPHWNSIYDWIEQDEQVAIRFERARARGAEAIAEETLTIADDRDEDPASRRVRIETRLKLLAKWHPKRYGDRIQADVAHSGSLTVVSGVPRE